VFRNQLNNPEEISDSEEADQIIESAATQDNKVTRDEEGKPQSESSSQSSQVNNDPECNMPVLGLPKIIKSTEKKQSEKKVRDKF